jgi:hypothetical protein
LNAEAPKTLELLRGAEVVRLGSMFERGEGTCRVYKELRTEGAPGLKSERCF